MTLVHPEPAESIWFVQYTRLDGTRTRVGPLKEDSARKSANEYNAWRDTMNAVVEEWAPVRAWKGLR